MNNNAPHYRGMIGNKKCEHSLEDILMEADDHKLTSLVMSQYNDFKLGLVKLECLADADLGFYTRMLLLWRKDRLVEWDDHRDRVPVAVYTHLRTCMVTEFREALREAETEHEDKAE